MTLLTDRQIMRAIRRNKISISAFDKDNLQPTSVDLTLDKHVKVQQKSSTPMGTLHPDNPELYTTVNLRMDKFVIQPGDFVLASTRECVGLSPRYAARLEGKSSLGRFGLLVHVTAGFIDPGFMGFITLEIANVSRVPRVLHPGMKIGQLCFFKLRRRPRFLYGDAVLKSRYQHQIGPTLSGGVDIG